MVGMYCMREELIFNLKKKVYFSDNMKVTLVFNIRYVVDYLKDIVICEKQTKYIRNMKVHNLSLT